MELNLHCLGCALQRVDLGWALEAQLTDWYIPLHPLADVLRSSPLLALWLE